MEQVSVNGIFHNNLINNPRGLIVGGLLIGYLIFNCNYTVCSLNYEKYDILT